MGVNMFTVITQVITITLAATTIGLGVVQASDWISGLLLATTINIDVGDANTLRDLAGYYPNLP